MSANIIQYNNDFQFRLAIEKALLTTLLFKDLNLDKDFDYFLDYKLDYKLFNANNTHKLVAKAIFNQIEQEQPYDEETIARYIKKRINLDDQAYIDILSAKPISRPTFDKYMSDLKHINKEERILELMRGA